MKNFIYSLIVVSALSPSALTGKLVDLAQSGSSFDDMIKKHKHVVAFFSTDWCSYCPEVEPVFKEVSEDAALQDVLFLEVDGDEFKADVRKFDVGFPSILYFKNGKMVKGKGSRIAMKDAAGLSAEVKKKFGL